MLDEAQLDMAHYQTLMTNAPADLISQLTPHLNDAPPPGQVPLQLQIRYLLASTYYHLSQRSNIAPVAGPGLQLARDYNDAHYESRFLGILAIAVLGQGETDQATAYANDALQIARTLAPDSTLHGEVLLLAAQVYYESGAIQNALKVMVKANDVFAGLNDQKNRSEALASIALMYDELGQPEQALDYHFKSLELIDVNQNRVEASITYYNIALTYRNMANPQQAREYAQLSLEFALQAEDTVGAAYARYELAQLDEEAGKLESALRMANDILPVFEQHSINGMIILTHLLRARVTAQLDRPGWQDDLATGASLVAKTPTLKRRLALTRTQASVYESQRQLDTAITYYKQWVALNDEQLSATQEQSTRRYQAMFELTEAEAENQLLNTQKKLAETELEAREFRQWLLIIVSLLLLLVLAAVAAGLMLQIKTKKKFKELALMDELTHTRNRRSISVFAQKAMSAARDTQNPLCFAMIDVDHFKQFNDRFGHDVGDEVLVQVANVLMQELRQGDALGRWGGEEWLIVLPNSSCDTIHNVFSRIQARLQRIELSLPEAPAVTVSMGCTDLHPADASLETIIKRADDALYHAKAQGRNRVEVKQATAPTG